MASMKNNKLSQITAGCVFFIFLAMGCVPKQTVITEENLEIKDLNEFINILEGYRNGVLANRNGEKLRTQIMTFSYLEGNRAYFCTTNDKPLYAQLVKFPFVSYCIYPENWEPVLSLNGKAVFVSDKTIRERALDANYYAKRNFKTTDNPLLEVFYIDVDIIETYGSDGTNIYAAKR